MAGEFKGKRITWIIVPRHDQPCATNKFFGTPPSQQAVERMAIEFIEFTAILANRLPSKVLAVHLVANLKYLIFADVIQGGD